MVLHSQKNLTIQQGKVCYLNIWSNPCRLHKECQAGRATELTPRGQLCCFVKILWECRMVANYCGVDIAFSPSSNQWGISYLGISVGTHALFYFLCWSSTKFEWADLKHKYSQSSTSLETAWHAFQFDKLCGISIYMAFIVFHVLGFDYYW